MRVRVMAGIATLAAWVTILAAVPGASSEDVLVRYDRESRYYRIQVVDYPANGRRCLHFSKSRGVQSSMILADPARLDLKYSQTMIAALALHPDPRDVLLVGLGGASIPKFLQKYYPELELDIVELDPDVVRVCQDYFEFRGNAKTRVFVMDGRMYLKRAEKQYDLILLDAYAADHVPFHLTTVEFIQLVKSHLKPGGVAASNLWEKAINRFYLAELKTFQATFPQVYLLPAARSGNLIIFGTMADEPVTRKEWVLRAESLVCGRDIGFDLADLIGREYQCLTDRKIDEAVLTDDKAPVNTLRHEHPKHFEEEGASP
jgi:spermidine synthase